MNKIKLLILMMVLSVNAYATSLTIPYQNEQPGGVITSGHWNSDMQAIAQWANNNSIDGNTNIATAGVTTSTIANGAVTNAKIDSSAGIFTYGDVYGSALISLPSIASSAGEIPTANLGTGTPTAVNFLSGNQTWLSTSNLYNYTSSGSTSSTPASILKIAYGTIATSSSASTTQITNLPFTSSTSYVVTATNMSNATGITCTVQSTSFSASSFFLLSSTNASPCNWVAIGT